MAFDPLLADVRFGYGRAPAIASPDSVVAMIDGLSAPDAMARRYRVDGFDTLLPRMQERGALVRLRREAPGTARAEEARKAIGALSRTVKTRAGQALAAHLLRRAQSATPFRERLEGFWANHFTAYGKSGLLRFAAPMYVESAIRPHLAGRFEDLLIAAVTHPMMVHYLDQDRSFGPGSVAAKGRGLNENLAREILELHTLGVDGPYTQTDVRELAELLTGLTFNQWRGRRFVRDRAEPGAETVLGRLYGGGDPRFDDIRAVLRDLARHPATARHVTRKLAVHFVSEAPSDALLSAVQRAWVETDGNLPEVCRALLTHPDAWQGPGRVRSPSVFMAAACRALGVEDGWDAAMVHDRFLRPMVLMGEPWLRPPGPDGFPEEDAAWVTPQGMATRLQWALNTPRLLVPDLPDPRDFVETALGARADDAVRFAARAAESRSDGIGLILASPAFQRG